MHHDKCCQSCKTKLVNGDSVTSMEVRVLAIDEAVVCVVWQENTQLFQRSPLATTAAVDDDDDDDGDHGDHDDDDNDDAVRDVTHY